MTIKDEWIDLHLHSCCSDGLLSPTEVTLKAKEVGLKAIGIVDHDTIEGIPEAIQTGKTCGIEVVPGVELSSKYRNKDIHILGYYLNPEHESLLDYLKKFRDERYRRAVKMVKNLNRLGLKLSMDDVESKAHGDSLGRPHLAEVLMERGYVETFQEAFHKYIGYGSSAYEEKYRILPEEAIRLISEANGLSFLAHPGYSLQDSDIAYFIKSGLDGIEVLHPNLNENRTQHLQEIAKMNHLLMSGGSDCHGGRNGKLLIGNYSVPYAILNDMKKVLQDRYEKENIYWDL